MVFDTLVPCIAGKWTCAMHVVIWATGPMFAPRAMNRRNAADAACSHHHRIISVIPRVPSVAERTQRRTASAESASRCPTSCAKDGGAAVGARGVAPTQLEAKKDWRKKNHSPALIAADRHLEDAPAPEDAPAANRALAPEGVTRAAVAPVREDDRVPRAAFRSKCLGRTRPG